MSQFKLPKQLLLRTADVQKLFDIICDSMDWGSGFLETDDVLLLRGIAVRLGVDPMEATPNNQRSSFVHDFKEQVRSGSRMNWTDELWERFYAGKCEWCDKTVMDYPHQNSMQNRGVQ